MYKILLLSFFVLCIHSVNAQHKDSPKLIVGIVIDQMCYDYLYRFYDKYSEGGFKMLMDDGANCRTTKYNYVPTYTGPGHASIYTGTTPSNHGIVANDWYDREGAQVINCVGDSLVNTVGSDSDYGKFSPMNLKANTITDQLKLTYPNAKVISMSIKNRGAILPGGHLSDGSYWYDFKTGGFITSTFFKSELPKWVSDFNGEDKISTYLSNNWDTYYPIENYTESDKDDTPYEHLFPGKETPTFPYRMDTISEITDRAGLFVYTPYCDNYLTDFAIESIDNEGLGKDDQTDMLCISYSTPDIIGHAFGPYSKEIEDTYLRLDLDIQRLIETLEKKVGKRDFTVFLTADHAVVPVPQRLMDNNLPGGYVFIDTNLYDLKLGMNEKFGGDLIEGIENLNIYLSDHRIDSLKLDKKEVVAFISEELKKWKGVKRVFTADQLYNGTIDDEWMDMVRNGFHRAESGDIIFTLEPGYLPKSIDSETARKGTSHGSAYGYDTHVPLLWYGKNIANQEIMREVEITDISATLTHLLYLQMPNALTGSPIIEILK